MVLEGPNYRVYTFTKLTVMDEKNCTQPFYYGWVSFETAYRRTMGRMTGPKTAKPYLDVFNAQGYVNVLVKYWWDPAKGDKQPWRNASVSGLGDQREKILGNSI